MVFEGLIVFSLFLVGYVTFYFYQKKVRLKFVEAYEFHPSIKCRVKDKYPHLNKKQLDIVINGLRAYFIINQTAGKKWWRCHRKWLMWRGMSLY
ncbi:hypothetical protein MO867_03605 [Microbulbifer sp. OS29]|uniref:Uncharacterized protein n=1 Tax=Microbulbifer okhotskensis TaxID=2926617 RepID=A0A9X2J4J7_9GAMM|nr:hypothetical protein [Microbulbifer okhotskensis]MCO1333419.1 hypothetical protein [Microbulbifer okhotskensis]